MKKLMNSSLASYKLRFAKAEDVPLILSFIKELADYEKMLDQVVATEEILRESLFELKKAEVLSTPRISAHHSEAQLVHEAAIGRIESEQLIKLMSLGFSEQEAEDTILNGFLK